MDFLRFIEKRFGYAPLKLINVREGAKVDFSKAISDISCKFSTVDIMR